MEYCDFLGNRVSRLGFGTMRLPVTEDGKIDRSTFEKMIDLAFASGINFFDTAVPYHTGTAESFLGEALKKYPRESYYLSDKFPGHQIMPSYDPAPVFEKQLGKCRTSYFDYYLLHNVYENSLATYTDESNGILPYFIKQKKEGRIRRLGFSSHARPDTLKKILDIFGDEIDFVLIQLNYLDRSMQDAEKKYEIIASRGKQIMVMEPLRGGKLANIGDKYEKEMAQLHPGSTSAEWAFGYLRNLPEVRVILSGMSTPEQLKANAQIFSRPSFIGEEEQRYLYSIAETMKNSLPCTACRYCCDGCPAGLDIPMLIGAANDMSFAYNQTVAMQLDALPEDKLPSACISCGRCLHICPQKIDIPKAIKTLADTLAAAPKWKDICAEREKITDYK